MQGSDPKPLSSPSAFSLARFLAPFLSRPTDFPPSLDASDASLHTSSPQPWQPWQPWVGEIGHGQSYALQGWRWDCLWVLQRKLLSSCVLVVLVFKQVSFQGLIGLVCSKVCEYVVLNCCCVLFLPEKLCQQVTFTSARCQCDFQETRSEIFHCGSTHHCSEWREKRQ